MTTDFGKSCSLDLLCVSFVNVYCLVCVCVLVYVCVCVCAYFPFGFESVLMDLTVLIFGYCFSIHFGCLCTSSSLSIYLSIYLS